VLAGLVVLVAGLLANWLKKSSLAGALNWGWLATAWGCCWVDAAPMPAKGSPVNVKLANGSVDTI